jgi:hypothetical protein
VASLASVVLLTAALGAAPGPAVDCQVTGAEAVHHERLAVEALRLLDSEKPEDYALFFLGGNQPDIPSRSGYYLGYRIASEADKTRSLAELATMKPGESGHSKSGSCAGWRPP